MRNRKVVGAVGLFVGLIVGASVTVASAGPPETSSGPAKPVREQNLDESGAIRVHEQGTASVDVVNENLDVTLANSLLDVNVTNSSVPVNGTVEVNNLPSTQDVNIVGGSAVPAPVTQAKQFRFTLPAGNTVQTETFPEIAATSLILVNPDSSEYSVKGITPLAPGGPGYVELGADFDGAIPNMRIDFPYPMPLTGLMMHCVNESDDCHIWVLVLGY